MVDNPFTEIIAITSIIVSIIAIYRSTKTTTDSRRGIVLQKYSEEIRRDNPVSNALMKFYSGKVDSLSFFEKIRILHFFKDLNVQVASGRISSEVVLYMFLRFAEDILKCDAFWCHQSQCERCIVDDKAELEKFVLKIKKSNNNKTPKV